MAPIRTVSKRQAIKDQVVRWIEEQQLGPGDQILSQNRLAEILGTTAVTVHKALTELAQEGILYREKGSGTYVGRAPAARTRSICLVLPGEHLDEPEYNPIYWPYVQCLYRAFLDCVSDGCAFSTRVVKPDAPHEPIADSLAGYDGVFFHHSKEPRNLLDYLVRNTRIPVVAFGLPREELSCLTIDHDVIHGTGEAIAWLVGLGYRRIGFIGAKYQWGDIWLDGYRQALLACGFPYRDDWVVRIGETQRDGAEGARQLLSHGFDGDAIFVDSDMRALGVVDELQRSGIKVPEEIAVMGYDGLENATRQAPYLSSLRIPYKQMITAGLEAIKASAGMPTPNEHRKFTGHVIAGRTTRSVAATAVNLCKSTTLRK